MAHRLPLLFSNIVTEHWFGASVHNVPQSPGTYQVVVDDTLPENRRLMLLEAIGSPGILTLSSAMARQLGIDTATNLSATQLSSAMHAMNLQLNGADNLYYFSVTEQATLAQCTLPAMVRQLTAEDSRLFAEFQSQAPISDLDEAFVELDHWRVFGAFAEGQLACVASMYPWAGSPLADLGVITLPSFRGQGLATMVVRALSAHALTQGLEPQYRCQLDNQASNALARASGLSLFGTWDVLACAAP